MDEKIKNLKEKIADGFDLPKDIVIDVPKITIIGNNEISIENHKGIVAFDNEQIKIRTRIGVLCIEGSGIEIFFIGKNTITLGGDVKSLSYEGGV